MRWCLLAATSIITSTSSVHINQHAFSTTIFVTFISSLFPPGRHHGRGGRGGGLAAAFIPHISSSTRRAIPLTRFIRGLQQDQQQQKQQQLLIGTRHYPSRTVGWFVRFVCSSSATGNFGWRDMMGERQTTLDASSSSSSSSSSNIAGQVGMDRQKEQQPLFVVCSKCHGEGILRKPPSRKARLRHKRQQQQQRQQQQPNNDNAATEKTKAKDNNGDKSQNNKPRQEQQQHHLPPRIEPCSHCHASGLVQIEVSATTTKTTNANGQKDVPALLPTVAIVGGGLAGLALATACGHRGIPATVYERDGHFGQRRQGYGLTLQQASKALASLGMSSASSSSSPPSITTTNSMSSEAAADDDDDDNNTTGSSSAGSRDWITSTRHLVHKPDGTVVGEWGLRKWKQQPTPVPDDDRQIHQQGQVKEGEEEQVESVTCTQRQQQPQQQPRCGRGRRRQNVHIARQALRYQLLLAAFDASRSFAIQNGGSVPNDQNGTSASSTAKSDTKQDSNNGDDEAPVVVQWNHKFLEYTEKDSGRLELCFQVDGDSDKQVRIEADLLVGADGIRSQVRRQLLDENEVAPLRYLNCLVILGICPLSSIIQPVADAPPLGDKSLKEKDNNLLDGHTVFQTADGTTRIYVMPYSETECMWQLSFPMSSEDEATALSLQGPGALLQQAMELCQTWHAPIPQILNATPVSLVSGYPVYDRQPLDKLDPSLQQVDDDDDEDDDEPYSSSKDSQGHRRITLIGDACHPMSPFKGQGANQALLDALSLANSIYTTYVAADKKRNKNHDSKIESPEDAKMIFNHDALLQDALSRFEDEMLRRSAVKVKASAEAAQFLHSDVAIQQGDVTRGAAAAANKKRRTTDTTNKGCND